ncbi:hypothetical protein SDRG_17071 [Saprolegnia diclina VS20]|uniref:WRKY19-like zinc finger domain-containing protein n=1 Tax=Saprolegnia diclina (strain VS20) TaxID=1156394 RepID=T0PVL3_SAPDV|nr:hypothetical protein SDRG_17071 [Saprolegnia diclina VS20]EQC25045.1 hypothetical protein SDRG_17071 [Saprolegnia diclina VS20]|eukprot:XP_008621528.1 hypothetical protein SDRG_17071 [Saprolegnia diclina VS20]
MSIDKLQPLGDAPTLVTRLMRMESFLDESKAFPLTVVAAADHGVYQPLFMEKELYDMELDPFNFDLDALELPSDENDLPLLNFNANIADIHTCDATSTTTGDNLDWTMMCAKKEMDQITPLPYSFGLDTMPTKAKDSQKRVPLAPRATPPAAQTSFLPASMMPPTSTPLRVTIPVADVADDDMDNDDGADSPNSSARKTCTHAGCNNRARSHQKCKKHGGARQCTHAGCLKNSQSRGLCIAHGGGSRCRFDGCHRASQSRGLCKSHGGGKFCAVDGCKKKAHLKQLCRMHGGC